MNKFVVYECYDKDGILLYVGYTRDIRARMDNHKSNSKWFIEIDHVKTEILQTRREAIELERKLIIEENPLHNIQKLQPISDNEKLNRQMFLDKWGRNVNKIYSDDGRQIAVEVL